MEYGSEFCYDCGKLEIIETSFEAVHDMWSRYLWPGRQDIRPMSSMTDAENIDMTIYEKYEPTFWAVYIKNRDTNDLELIGCNSGHRTAERIYRSRGLYVDQEYRGNGIAQMLLRRLLIKAKLENCHTVWTLPRKESLRAYTAAGFEQRSEFFGTDTSNANCYAVAEL